MKDSKAIEKDFERSFEKKKNLKLKRKRMEENNFASTYRKLF
jgi:hypothetical protein